MAVFIFDFDLTITSEHTHNLLVRMINAGKLDANNHEQAWNVVKDVPPTAEASAWRELMMQLIDEGNSVAVATFNSFEEIVYRYLAEAINIPKDYLDKIIIAAWLPEFPSLANKNQHVKYVLQQLQKEDESKIFLIDDSEYNCLAAREHGWEIILFDGARDSLRCIEHIKELAKELKTS